MPKNSGTLISAPIRPLSTSSTIATAYSSEIRGGFHSVVDTSTRNSISYDRREFGMLVYVESDDLFYQLKETSSDLGDNGNWELVNINSAQYTTEWVDSVISRTSVNPNTLTPTNGDRYLIVSGVGSWFGLDNSIVEWSGSSWVTTTPVEGLSLRVDNESGYIYAYLNGVWVKQSLLVGGTSSYVSYYDSDGNLSGDSGFTRNFSSFETLIDGSNTGIVSIGDITNSSTRLLVNSNIGFTSKIDAYSDYFYITDESGSLPKFASEPSGYTYIGDSDVGGTLFTVDPITNAITAFSSDITFGIGTNSISSNKAFIATTDDGDNFYIIFNDKTTGLVDHFVGMASGNSVSGQAVSLLVFYDGISSEHGLIVNWDSATSSESTRLTLNSSGLRFLNQESLDVFFRIDISGNVGIGVDTPTYKLDIGGNVHISDGNGLFFGTGGQNISRGSFANGTGGDNGVSLNCAIGYELHWEGGRLSCNVGTGSYVPLIVDSNITLNGSIQIIDGSEGVGKVLTSDADGNASWSHTLDVGTSSFSIFGNGGGYFSYDGTSDVIELNGTHLTFAGDISSQGNILPIGSNTYNLGSTASTWNDLYIELIVNSGIGTYLDDAAAAIGNVPINGFYRETATGYVKARVS